MNLENAESFVNAMREDESFRHSVGQASDRKSLEDFLADQGYRFEMHDLVAAMAGCMDRMKP